jgi:hypothetical protein
MSAIENVQTQRIHHLSNSESCLYTSISYSCQYVYRQSPMGIRLSFRRPCFIRVYLFLPSQMICVLVGADRRFGAREYGSGL